MTIKILHIDTEMTWRGGENQLKLLIEGSQKEACHFLAANPNSEAAKRMQTIAKIIQIKTNSPFGLLGSAIKLAKQCQQLDIQLIDCHSSKSHSLGLLVKSMFPKVKLVIHRRVDFPPSDNLWSKKKYLSKKIDRFIAISDEIANILVEYGVNPKCVTTVHSGVNPTPFLQLNREQAYKEIREELGIDDNRTIIANVAYHTEQKGMETLILGLKELFKKRQDFVCLLAGEGHLTSKLKTMTHEAKLDNHVMFLGIRNDIPRILAAADIFALPSNKEGLGTSILDALFSKCAVAASRVGGIPEMIIHEKTGLLSEVGDYKQFSKNLNSLIHSSKLRSELALSGLKHIEEKFTQEAMANGNIATYRSLLE